MEKTKCIKFKTFLSLQDILSISGLKGKTRKRKAEHIYDLGLSKDFLNRKQEVLIVKEKKIDNIFYEE